MSEEEYDSDRYDSYDDDGKMSESDAGKRAYHNLLERKRRDNIKDSFSQLRDVLPFFNKKKKASRVQILKKARDFINQQPDLNKLKEECTSLDDENKLLEKALADLERAAENNDTEEIERVKLTHLALKRRHFVLENDDSESEDGDSSDEDSSSYTPPPVAVASSSRRKFKRT